MSANINSKEIANLASLAKLQVSEAEEQSLMKDLAKILDYVSILQSVKVDGISLAPNVRLLSELRPDVARPAGIALMELLPEERLDDSLLQTPNVFISHESAETNNN